jgi:hypothetical protein
MNKLFAFSTGAIPFIAPMTNQTAAVTGNGAMKARSTKKLGLALLGATLALCQVATAQPQKAVYLGAAARFAVLSQAGITNTGNTVINGDIGVWPITGASITGFSECTGSSCVSENAGGPGKVNGQIWDHDSRLETTVSQHGIMSLGIAMRDAAGRTGAFTPVNTDIGGLTFKPGLFRANSTLLITGNVYLSGAGVYIFQVGTGLNVGANVHIILENGATASNVFWQVGTAAIFGSNIVFAGTVMAGSGITMTTGTTLNGRALANTAVTFINDVVTRPPSRGD